jgi:cellulose synthase/poly-beta-1,6-N-acetylglucosamine synthase-like glycosyltransferase
MAEVTILIILSLLAAVYAGYPLLVVALAALRRPRPAPHGGRPPSSVSIVVCAHNEAAAIGAKLRSVIASASGRSEHIEVIVVDDGSTDATAAIVAGIAAASPVPLRLMRLARGGKAAALRAALATAKGEVLVFSDADPLWDERTLGALLLPFADPRVGAVAGEVRSLRGPRQGPWRAGDALFRRYESAIRSAEDRLFGCVSADGGLFAMRAELAEPVPPDVTDDFFLSTAAVVRGYRIAFTPEAAAFELPAAGGRQHFRRRVRITVRGLTGLWRRRALMNPLRTGGYAFALVFHKLLRRLAPLSLVPLAGAVLWLTIERGRPLELAVFAALCAGAAGAAALLLLPIRMPRALRLPLYLAIHLGGLAIGSLLFLAGRRYIQWAPQQR